MTRHKDLKRLVRSRMRKTGESYTAARAMIVARHSSSNREHAEPARYAAPRAEWPALAGVSDDRVMEKTGRSWAQWVALLDKAGAHEMPHRDIARHVSSTFSGISPWWAQTITVGYERIRGLRDVGQGRDGRYEANKSRTFPVGASRLYRMVRDARNRRKWLPEGVIAVRGAVVDKSIRVDWHDGTRVSFHFVAKGASKCTVAVQHAMLTSRADVENAKSFWAERFDALGSMLE